MTDYDETRKRRKASAPYIKRAKPRFYDNRCVKCGMYYMTDTPPYNIPGAMSSEGFICVNCRSSSPKRKASPPPERVQMTIAEAFGTKK